MILKNKKVAVIGLGKSGFAAAKFLVGKKARARVTDASDKKEVLENASYLKSLGAEVETGGHTEAFVAGSDFCVTSPGVPKNSLPLAFAKKKKIPIISEVELAASFCQGKIIAVTGSNGKTTTCSLIHRLLADAGRKSVLCGNVGYSFLDALAEIDDKTIVVLELSSFQLEDSPAFRPEVAVVLNISRNHLDRHHTLKNYIRAKERIFKNQRKQDFLILNHDDTFVKKMASKACAEVIFCSKEPISEGVFLKDGNIEIQIRKTKRGFLDPRNFHLKGGHNLQNILAAVAAASLFKVPLGVMQKSLDAFETIEHRIELLGEIGGVHFVNDSKSTTVDSTKAAILSVQEPLVLIAGGRDKGAFFGEIEDLLEERVKTAVLYGEAREKIAASWKKFKRCKTENNFKDAVRLAFEEARRGDCVLLSPMCASFDQFFSFEERGEAFKKIFEELKDR